MKASIVKPLSKLKEIQYRNRSETRLRVKSVVVLGGSGSCYKRNQEKNSKITTDILENERN